MATFGNSWCNHEGGGLHANRTLGLFPGWDQVWYVEELKNITPINQCTWIIQVLHIFALGMSGSLCIKWWSEHECKRCLHVLVFVKNNLWKASFAPRFGLLYHIILVGEGQQRVVVKFFVKFWFASISLLLSLLLLFHVEGKLGLYLCWFFHLTGFCALSFVALGVFLLSRMVWMMFKLTFRPGLVKTGLRGFSPGCFGCWCFQEE